MDGLTLAFADQHKYSLSPLWTYCVWQLGLNNEMRSINVQDCVFRLSLDEFSSACIHPGIFLFFAEQACSFAYLFLFFFF